MIIFTGALLAFLMSVFGYGPAPVSVSSQFTTGKPATARSATVGTTITRQMFAER